jgi:hypothetical protein
MKVLCEVLFNIQKRQNLVEDPESKQLKGAELRMEKTMGFLTALLHTNDEEEADVPHLFKLAKKQKTKKMDKEKEKVKPILPTLEEMYTRLHKEYKALR